MAYGVGVKVKTLIELFDKCQFENIASGIKFKPEKIVFVGFKEVMTPNRINDLRTFLKNRGLQIETEFEVVGRYDFDAIVDRLNYIVDRNEDCFFDLTGGKELVLTAMGVVSAERNVPMLQINIRTGNVIKIKNCEALPDGDKMAVSIDESILLNGGCVLRDNDLDIEWDITDSFRRDVELMWKICRENCKQWNRQANSFEAFERYGRVDNTLGVYADLSHVALRGGETFISNEIINELIKNNFISEYILKNDIISFRYKNQQIHRCLIKAGNILELYGYILLKELIAENATLYNDIDVGVFADWDGVIHNSYEKQKDTTNEIDLMVMKGLVPVFISCKNGEVKKEALYELSTVANKLGGKYAKKVLLTTYINRDEDSKKYLLARANEMNIQVIDGVENMSRDEIKNRLRNRI